MKKAENVAGITLVLILALFISLLSPCSIKPALANPDKLRWTIIDTPSENQTSNIIVSPSEINAVAIGSDGKTFYTVDTPNRGGYKSTDGGITWPATDNWTGYLVSAGATLPAWNVAVAPDDTNFVVAVTDNFSPPYGPARVFLSEDGGLNWQNTNFPPIAGFISCIDVSMLYGDGKRDIAVGTRTGASGGKVYVRQAPGFVGWIDQTVAPSVGWLVGDNVTTLKFSPAYISDLSLIVISTNINGTFLNLGTRDLANNRTTWNTTLNYPVRIVDTNYPGSSPNINQLITADLELPSDFSGADPGDLRRYYVSTDANDPATQNGVYRIDSTVVNWISRGITSRTSSISYYGTYDGGKLLAGEVIANNSIGMVNVWRCFDPVANTPTWLKSDALKSPTGGGNSGRANAQVYWSPDGNKAYCATSSANLTAPANWPSGYLTGLPLDESAFSLSLDDGNIWNQLSLIDTEISFLSDFAVLEAPEDSQGYNILYLASINNNVAVTQNFDSVWRSIGQPLGKTWERILCSVAPNNDTILRINPRNIGKEAARSKVVVFSDRFTDNLTRYSANEGQSWQIVFPGFDTRVTDITLASDEVIYILDNNAQVRKGTRSGTNWKWQGKIDTLLNGAHTIATPLKNPKGKYDKDEDWVIAGDAIEGKAAYANFSEAYPKFEPTPVSVLLPGNMHVIADDNFHQNKIIYAGSNNGRIYRWTIGKSTDWYDLEPLNNAFFGLAQGKGTLYGAWAFSSSLLLSPPPGVDRTLYPTATRPPPIEWDDLTTKPIPPASVPTAFTREPSALKISQNANNTLWAIDNAAYQWSTNKIGCSGCLWAYTDTLAKAGPWTTSPASGDYIPVDPVTGRATEINFRWRQLADAWAYELQLAKDDKFSLRLTDNITPPADNITPSNPLSPAWILPAGILETNHAYYWRVRANQGVTGELIRSPWSATMLFTVKAGLPVRVPYYGIQLLTPKSGCIGCPVKSLSFSWSQFMDTTNYKFVLAKDAAMAKVLIEEEVSTTGYKYEGTLEYNANYFWRVMAVEPAPSDWSATFSFMTEAAPKSTLTPEPQPGTPSWVWHIVAVVAFLFIVVMVFAAMTRQEGWQDLETSRKRPYSRSFRVLVFKIRDTIKALFRRDSFFGD